MARSRLTTFVQATALGAFLVSLLLPAAQMRYGLIEEERLHGVEASVPTVQPSFSWRDFKTEQFQRQFDSWFQEHLGFRGYLIRTDNQLNLSLFSEMSSTYGSPLVLGRESNLFERIYIDDFNQAYRIGEAKVRFLARRIAQARKLLSERGIPLLILLSPSKATVYQEDIPPRYIATDVDRSTRNYHQLVDELTRAEVPFFDGLAFVLDLKGKSTHRIFPKSGTHWSQHTSCLVVAILAERLSSLIGRQLPQAVCNPPEFRSIPDPFDRDLADLSNIWNVSRFYTPLPYPPARSSGTESTLHRPNLIFIGGSFLWTIFESFEKNEIYRERTMLYYFKRAFHYPSGRSEPISAKRFDWKERLRGVDAVVLEINEANIHQAGGGSVGDIIRDLAPKRRRRR